MTNTNHQIEIDFLENNFYEFSDKLKEAIYKALNKILELEDINSLIEVTINLVSPKEIQELNLIYRNKDSVTDVLSFPIFTDINDLKSINSTPILLGDVILNIDRANEQALNIGHSLDKELLYLTIHSFLHLLGFDHENSEDKVVMRKREKEILEFLNNET